MKPAVLNKLADEFGYLKAQISALCEREKELKEIFIASNQAEIEGSLFRVTISSTDRETLDANEVRKLLTHDQLQACTRITQSTVVRCNAKKR